MRIQLKRGTSAQLATYTPVEGELVVVDVDSTSPTLVVGDGTTAGGKSVNFPMPNINYFGSVAVTGSNTITADASSEELTYDSDGLSISANESTQTITFTNPYKTFFGLNDVDITSGAEANDMVLISGDGSELTSASFTEKAAAFLAAMLTVDGDGSTLDADLLDGNEATAFMTNATVTAKGDLLVATGSASPERFAVGANNKILVADSTNPAGVSWGAVPLLFNWVEKATSFTSIAGTGYILNTATPIICTLPSNPVFGNQVKIIDGAGAAATNNITINPGSEKIDGQALSVTLDYNKAIATYTFYNSVRGWIEERHGLL